MSSMRTSFEEEFNGKLVLDSAGVVLGEIHDVLIDRDTWMVDAFTMRVRRELNDQLGVESHFLSRSTIEIPARLIQSVGDAVILRVGAADLRNGHSGPEATPPPAA
jgi:sporulation protein YlmC with PRC-barrel domain